VGCPSTLCFDFGKVNTNWHSSNAHKYLFRSKMLILVSTSALITPASENIILKFLNKH